MQGHISPATIFVMLITRPRALGAMRAFSTKPPVLGYGESMLRYAPMRPEGAPDAHGRRVPSAVAPFMRSVGGDELNVLVALARLGYPTRYASVLPEGPLGAVVGACRGPRAGSGRRRRGRART